ncbi:hypothetical protein C0993_008613 [Termitomyces sp. T159_Od127]|nr:hypothetical protein C0993_008613 [Termitomyces sp. T159_Od127]
MFLPSHIGPTAPPVDFGHVFDVPRLRKTLNIPILEWHEVKDRDSEEIDEIGCWNTWAAVAESEDQPRHSFVPDHLKLAPKSIKVPSWDGDTHSYFWSLAALAFPETREANLVPPHESPDHHVLLPPDEQMLCYDYMYYVCANEPFEMGVDYSPAWRFVGKYLHWSPRIEKLAYQYVRQTLGTPEDEPTPPASIVSTFQNTHIHSCLCIQWIAIHVRRARRVDEVKTELLQRKGISVEHVIMTSDERDTVWWDDVKGKGWYPIFIDAAIQSLGVGFVGTDQSTMSMVARRRVESWTDGAVRIFKWGEPNADDH